MEDLEFGMMKCWSDPIGGATETFSQGGGGYYTPQDTNDPDCAEFVGGVDFTVFACDAGDYAAAYWSNGAGRMQSGTSSNTYSNSTLDGNWLEQTDTLGFTRYGATGGYELQMYFINTL